MRKVDFQESLPSSTSEPIMVAVIALVHEPMCIWSVTWIGWDDPILRIPMAPVAASRSPMQDRADQARQMVLVANRPEQVAQPGHRLRAPSWSRLRPLPSFSRSVSDVTGRGPCRNETASPAAATTFRMSRRLIMVAPAASCPPAELGCEDVGAGSRQANIFSLLRAVSRDSTFREADRSRCWRSSTLASCEISHSLRSRPPP